MYVCICKCVSCAHSTCHCSAIPLSDVQQHSQTHTAEPNRPGSAYQSKERERDAVTQGDKEQEMKGKKHHSPPPPPPPSLLIFTSAVSLSSRPAECLPALQFIQRDSPSQAFPPEGGGGGSCRRLAVRWRSSFVLITIDCF